MGKFFNDKVIEMKSIPRYQSRRGSLESLRREFNAALHSEETEQDRIEYTDGAVGGESSPVVSTNKEDGAKPVRRTRKSRVRKTRNKQGV